MDLLVGLPRQYGYALTLLERGLAVMGVVSAVVAAFRSRQYGIRAALLRSASEALIAGSLVAIWAFTVAPLARFLPGDVPQPMVANLVPVLPLIDGLRSTEGWRLNAPNLIANVILYAPLGLGLRWRLGLRMRWVVLIAASLSSAVEVSQALSDQLRSADINDVLLNAAGATVGAWAFTMLAPPRPSPISGRPDRPPEIPADGRGA